MVSEQFCMCTGSKCRNWKMWCDWTELKENFKQEVPMQGAIVFCFCSSDFTRWGFDGTTWKKIRLNFQWRCYFNTLMTQKGSSNTKMYSYWDSKHDFFPRIKLWTTQSCVKIETSTDNWSSIQVFEKNNPENDILCGNMFTVEQGQSNQFITLVNVKSKSKYKYFLTQNY